MEPALVAVGGALGAVCRYAVGELLGERAFPWATLAVNAVGSFVLGLVLFGGVGDDLTALAAIGFCGAFTTFSSFSFQTVALWERGDRGLAAANAVGNLLCSLVALGAAWLLVG